MIPLALLAASRQADRDAELLATANGSQTSQTQAHQSHGSGLGDLTQILGGIALEHVLVELGRVIEGGAGDATTHISGVV